MSKRQLSLNMEALHAGPGLEDLAGAALESSPDDVDMHGEGGGAAAEGVHRVEEGSGKATLPVEQPSADPIADYDSDATQCSEEGEDSPDMQRGEGGVPWINFEKGDVSF